MTNVNTKRVFAIIIASLLIIALIVSLGYAIETGLPANLEQQIENQVDLNDLINNIDGDDEDENSSQSQQEVKVYTNGFKCLSDAMDNIVNGKGVKYRANISAFANISGIGNFTQNITEIATLSGDYYLKETYASCNMSFGLNMYRYIYTADAGETIDYKVVGEYTEPGKSPNWTKMSESLVVNKEELMQKDFIAYDVLLLYPDKTNSNLVSFDRTSDKKYYNIKVTYDSTKFPEKFAGLMEQYKIGDYVSFSSITLTYKISKVTGQLKAASYVISVNASYMGVSVPATATATILFEKVNTALTPEVPVYCQGE